MNKLSKQIEIAKRLYGPKPEGSIRNDSYISEVRSRNPSIADVMADALNHRTRAELQGDLAESAEEITRLRFELETARALALDEAIAVVNAMPAESSPGATFANNARIAAAIRALKLEERG